MDSIVSGMAALAPPNADDVARLKDRERAGRDLGARTYLEKLEHSRGRFRFQSEIRTLVHHVAPRPEHDVLDAGSGVGRYALAIAARVRRLVCVDLSPVALEVLRERVAAHGLANVETRALDLAELPDSLGPFDTVYTSEVLQHIPTHEQHLRVMRAFHAVLKPGGRCLVNVVCWNRRSPGPKEGPADDTGMYWHRFAPREMRELFLAAGFRDVTLHGVTVLPGSVSRRLSPRFGAIETLCSRLQPLAGHGRLVLGIGRK